MSNNNTIIIRRPNNGAAPSAPRKRRTPKATIEEAHRIARAIERSSSGRAVNPYAVGMAVAKAERPVHPFAARMAAARAAAKRSGTKTPKAKKPRTPKTVSKKTAAAKPKKTKTRKPAKKRSSARGSRPKSAPFLAMAKKLEREGFSKARAQTIAAQRERASYKKRGAKAPK
jgi:hypothetical protein